MEADIGRNHQNAKELQEILQCWDLACAYAKDINMTKWSDADLSMLDQRLPTESERTLSIIMIIDSPESPCECSAFLYILQPKVRKIQQSEN